MIIRNKITLILLISLSIISEISGDQEGNFHSSETIPDMVSQIFWKLVIWGDNENHLLLNRLKIDLLPKTIQMDATQFIHRYQHFESRLKAPRNADKNSVDYTWITDVYFQQQQKRERSIVALIPGADAEAAAYVLLNPGCYEWEGFADCPKKEAQFAETYLHAFPDTPLKPYLLLLLMHRYRAITECQDVITDTALRNEALQRYEYYFQQVKELENPFILYLANAIYNAPFVYSDQFIQTPRRGVSTK